uniref:Uncharacterized protein n=1 Tax=Ditylenchus dipsaci TaxID=166011 RepID=A0A915EGG5_9BILA
MSICFSANVRKILLDVAASIFSIRINTDSALAIMKLKRRRLSTLVTLFVILIIAVCCLFYLYDIFGREDESGVSFLQVHLRLRRPSTILTH